MKDIETTNEQQIELKRIEKIKEDEENRKIELFKKAKHEQKQRIKRHSEMMFREKQA